MWTNYNKISNCMWEYSAPSMVQSLTKGTFQSQSGIQQTPIRNLKCHPRPKSTIRWNEGPLHLQTQFRKPNSIRYTNRFTLDQNWQPQPCTNFKLVILSFNMRATYMKALAQLLRQNINTAQKRKEKRLPKFLAYSYES